MPFARKKGNRQSPRTPLRKRFLRGFTRKGRSQNRLERIPGILEKKVRKDIELYISMKPGKEKKAQREKINGMIEQELEKEYKISD